eukprot:267257-Prymnesium_polylepis.1
MFDGLQGPKVAGGRTQVAQSRFSGRQQAGARGAAGHAGVGDASDFEESAHGRGGASAFKSASQQLHHKMGDHQVA